MADSLFLFKLFPWYTDATVTHKREDQQNHTETGTFKSDTQLWVPLAPVINRNAKAITTNS